jgi:hypothetical protein
MGVVSLPYQKAGGFVNISHFQARQVWILGQAELLIGLSVECGLLALPTNIRLGWK